MILFKRSFNKNKNNYDEFSCEAKFLKRCFAATHINLYCTGKRLVPVVAVKRFRCQLGQVVSILLKKRQKHNN